jgi:hypothetical protein
MLNTLFGILSSKKFTICMMRPLFGYILAYFIISDILPGCRYLNSSSVLLSNWQVEAIGESDRQCLGHCHNHRLKPRDYLEGNHWSLWEWISSAAWHGTGSSNQNKARPDVLSITRRVAWCCSVTLSVEHAEPVGTHHPSWRRRWEIIRSLGAQILNQSGRTLHLRQ